MVKTRHSSDHEDLACDQFITISTRRTRSTEQFEAQINGYHGGSEGEYDDVLEQSHPTRKTRATQRNISMFSGNTTDDETPPRTRRKHRREMQDREDHLRASGRIVRRHCRSQVNYLGEKIVGEVSCRRSTRQRKLMYDTFNQSLIDKQVSYYAPDDESCEEIEKPRKRRCREVELQPDDQNIDMYTRVKCERRLGVKRNMYVQENDDKEQEETAGSGCSDEGEVEEEEEEETEEEQNNSRQYFLREHKPRTKIYEAPIEPKRSRPTNIFRDTTPPRKSSRRTVTYSSPARRQNYRKRRKAAFHVSSSTSSSSASNDDVSDEERFERRKVKSMAKSRSRCLPMNIAPEDIATGFLKDRVKIGSSLADVDPMGLDRNITFESVGGLGKHVRALKEMVVFPLLYPEVFERFKITPPRGVLFYGPPGTGKTLVARALANECSSGERRVAFFMRKGADCLSKWVGESERQLRLLFDQAYQMRPSIIFFDEIDGLAPVRSSRQDQIHSSIVSTLLALMDGLDNRGEIVVIGATNRIDSIDPALRRPGRFDREFSFPLPSVQARVQILKIHTKDWKPRLSDDFVKQLAEKCAGYCGADLKALCTEACLHALRRRYPQIYHSQDKLLLDVDSITVAAVDFQKAMQVIVPTSQRSVTSPASSLSHAVRPLLHNTLNHALEVLRRSFPVALASNVATDEPDAHADDDDDDDNELATDEEEGMDIYDHSNKENSKKHVHFDLARSACQHPATHRPRLLLAGEAGQGQTTHLAPSIIYHMERLPVHVLDLPALYAVSARTPEESCAQIFREAKRTCPSIIYLPHIGQWWDVIGDTTRATFLTLLQDLDPTSPLLFLATNDEDYNFLPEVLRKLFSLSSDEVILMRNPSESERRDFFKDLLQCQAVKPPPTRKQSARRALEELPKAPPPQPRHLTPKELKKLQVQEEATLRELRLFLRDVLNKLGRDRKFSIFTKPVDEEEVPDYYDVITNPMDLSTMMHKIDLHQYETAKDFMDDIELIVSNCLEYNPDKDPADRAIRHRACTLKDTAQAILAAELDEDFDKLCEEIKEARKRRGEKATATVPSYYFTKPLGKGMQTLMKTSSQEDDDDDNVDVCKKPASHSVSGDAFDDKENIGQDVVPKIRMVVKKVALKKNATKNQSKSPWCRSGKRRYKKVVVYIDEYGNEIPPERLTRKESVNDKKEMGDVTDLERVASKEKTEESHQDDDDDDNSSGDDCDVAEAQKDTKSNCSCQASRSPRTKSSPVSPRTRRSPRCEQSPISSSERCNEVCGLKDEVKIKQVEEVKVPVHNREKSLSPDVSSRTRWQRKRSFSGSHSEPEPMECMTSTPDAKNDGKSPDKSKSPHNLNTPEKNKTQEISSDEKDGGRNKPGTQKQSMTRQRAMEILDQSVHSVIIDQKKLHQLLDKTVMKTEGCNIEELEKIYSMMSQCIYQHRLNYDKSHLLKDLEEIVDRIK